MAWSTTLKAHLAASTAKPRVTLVRYNWSNTPGTNTSIGRSAWQSSGQIGLSPGAPMALASLSVSVPDWASNRGTFRVALGGLAQAQWAANDMPRGAMCEVLYQYPGMAAPETVMFGRVNDHAGIGPQSIMSAWDILSAAESRPAWFGADESELFYHCDPASTHSDTTTSAYTPGSSTTITLTNPPTVERETAGTGAVLVTPISGAEPFILTYTGISGNDLTGVSTAAVYGTTASIAASGSTIQEVAWIDDRPTNVMLKVLTSTGTGTNGMYDTLPASWGFGFPSALVDTLGFNQAEALIAPASGNHDIRVVSTTSQTPGLAWMQAILQTFGLWLTMRQGQITCRAAVDRYASTVPLVMTLDSSNILATLPTRAIWDQGTAVEYGQMRMLYNGGASSVTSSSSAALVRTRPAAHTFEVDTGHMVYQNEAAIGAKLNERLGAWHERIPTVVELGATLEAAQLCPGDWVKIEHKGIWNPYTGAVFRAMVGAISIDWSANNVALRLYIQHPASEA